VANCQPNRKIRAPVKMERWSPIGPDRFVADLVAERLWPLQGRTSASGTFTDERSVGAPPMQKRVTATRWAPPV
jgi:hypothetical protein